MTEIVLNCPLLECRMPLEPVTIAPERQPADSDKAGKAGGHLHIVASGLVACQNGHRWVASDDFLLERMEP